MRRLLPIILLVASLAIGIRLGWKPLTQSLGPAVRVDFIDVGQGDSIFIKTPDGVNALIDAGNEEYGPDVVAHLRRLGVRRIDLVVMSHPEDDHIGGMPYVLDAFQVGAVLDSGYTHASDVQERVFEIIEAKKIPYHLAVRDMEFRLGLNTQLQVLAPGNQLAKGTKADANNNSVVVRLLFGRVQMLFPGDIGSEGEGRLIASHQDIESQVLKVANHGASDSTSLEFLRLVRPEYLILSVGAKNKDKNPNKDTLQRLSKERTSASMFRTDKNGTITVLTDGRRIVVETQR